MDPLTSLATALAVGAAGALQSIVAPAKEGTPALTRRMPHMGQ
jgi:hypothetical protein